MRNFNLGITYFQLNKIDEAIRAFTIAIEINPNYFQAYIERGNSFAVTSNFNNAILDFATAININPNSQNAS